MYKNTIKIMRWSCLALLLLGSLLLLVAANLGQPERLIIGQAAWDKDKGAAVISVYVDTNGDYDGKVTIPGNFLLLQQFEKFPVDQEFLIVLRRLGSDMIFERIYPLILPEGEELAGPHWDSASSLRAVLGTKPELVELIGLNIRIFRLRQPMWFRDNFAFTDRVGWQEGRPPALLAMLNGEYSDFNPNLWLVDSQNRVTNVRRTGPGLLTWPVLLTKTAIALYLLSLIPGVLALVIYRFPGLAEKVSRFGARMPRFRKGQSANTQEP